MQVFYTVKQGDTLLGYLGYIAYNAAAEDGFDIFILETRTNTITRLTNGLGDRLSKPFWSFDSKKLAFVGRGGIVYIVDIFSKSIAKIDQVEMGTYISWAHDNQRIAYTKGNRIVIYNTKTHSSSSINQTSPSYAQWFPDGTVLLFEGPDNLGISQLFSINIDGTEKRQITNNTGGRHNEVRLSNDGLFVLYTTPGVSVSLIRILEILTGRIFEVAGGPLGKNYNPEWSPNSDRIAYSATIFENSTYFSQIRTVGRQGQNDKIWAISSCFVTPVSWAPDNIKIAYLSECMEDGIANEIWVVDITHPVPIRLLNGVKIVNLAWSK